MNHLLRISYKDPKIPNKPWQEEAMLKFEEIFQKVQKEKNLNLPFHLTLDEDEALNYSVHGKENKFILYFVLNENEIENFCGLCIKDKNNEPKCFGFGWTFTSPEYEERIENFLNLIKNY